jgi:hypothetical protein
MFRASISHLESDSFWISKKSVDLLIVLAIQIMCKTNKGDDIMED